MRSYNLFFNTVVILILSVLTACSPFSEEKIENPIVELEFSDSTLQQSSAEPNLAVVGNLLLEIQEDATTKSKILISSAAFYSPSSKNVLFPDIQTGNLEKIIYEPLPEDDPCGIPGFPDCPNPKGIE
ncbi:MAG TPA: hypothetical protein PLJ21_01330 [Pseudobdellovibrionaceae bacterium]|mgnify:CR=1 FL=1|nr:hypothetical protein [Pseudobdellovibrionaceae bacterium]